ncbi:SDR family NAD(P)-dependent oxidoreductase [Streptobacillus felis]|uniref:SDR family oxidoreductase n=1 Tax=Streptobacillus felis TaxID=1384509 RepID=A0A7Z0PGL9_9FUSO|nr:SDR family NAD(P)-dependent oxidoreductase [Streptobacillus felis]NYV28338.1 SDR family oxidoreductase [Streptobacillus felis]
MEFKNKTCIVTGGANGIGLETVKGMVAGGAKVIILDINEEAAKSAINELGEDRVFFHYLDLSNQESIRSVFAELIQKYNKIDVLVNCAGIISTKRFDDLDDAEFNKVVSINLNANFTTISAIFEHFKSNGGGRIVNVSSVAAKLGGGLLGTAAYASSKAGLNGLTKAVAKEGGKYGIACNCVCPSYTETEMTNALKEDKEKESKVISMIPLGRKAQAREIAQMILFFASDLASFVTGEIGDVDGGITLDG